MDKPGEMPRGAGEYILVVDDEDAVGDVIGLSLEHLGYRVDVRHDPFDALNAVLAQSESYDAVLTDLSMPRMTGTELAVRLHLIRADLPVILVTGLLGSRAPDFQEARVCEVLQKPLSILHLALAMRRTLEVFARPGGAARVAGRIRTS